MVCGVGWLRWITTGWAKAGRTAEAKRLKGERCGLLQVWIRCVPVDSGQKVSAKLASEPAQRPAKQADSGVKGNRTIKLHSHQGPGCGS